MTEQKRTDYSVLDSISAVRTNIGMFIGNSDTPDHLATEVIDNMLDEVANKYATIGNIFLQEDGSFWVTDNGRGLKIGTSQDPDTKEMKDSIELLCSKLFSGSKFRIDNDVDYKVQIGMHGVGLVVVNSLSDWLILRIKKDNQIYDYTFIDSKLDSKTVYDVTDEDFSTLVGFKPSKKYFKSVKFDTSSIVTRLLLTQSVYDGCQFFINNREIPKITLEEFVRDQLKLSKELKLYQISKNTSDYESIRIFLTYDNSFDTSSIGDVNLRMCEGTFLTNTQTMIKNLLKTIIDKKYRDLDEKLLLSGLRLYVSLTLEKPEVDAQIKTRIKTDIRARLALIENDLKSILKNNHIKATIERLLDIKLSQKISKTIATTRSNRISNTNKLRDCIKTPGDVLYIVEGDSADGTLRQIKNRQTEASFPLKGKLLNVESGSLARIEKNQEIKQLIEAIGPKNQRRYRKIKILTDADSVCAETPIFYIDRNQNIKWDEIRNISLEEIDSVISFNLNSNVCELKKVKNIIAHKYEKNEIFRINTVNGFHSDCTDDHVIYVYDEIQKKIVEIPPTKIDINTHRLISPEYFPVSESEKTINILNDLLAFQNTRLYCLIKYEDFKFDLKPELVRVDISNRVDYSKINRTKLSSLIKVALPTLQMYDTGRDNTFAPLKIVIEMMKYVNINLTKTDVKIKFDKTMFHYINGNLFHHTKKINETVEITPCLAYLVGYYIGDGCRGSSKNNKYETQLSTGSEKYIIDILKNCCENLNFNTILIDYYNPTNDIFKIKSLELDAVLNNLGLNKNIKAISKFIPQIFFSCNEEVREALLMGLFHSDGAMFQYLSKNKKHTNYRLTHTTISKKLSSDVSFLLRQFGLIPIKQIKPAKKSGINSRGKQIIGRHNSYITTINNVKELKKIEGICETFGFDIDNILIYRRSRYSFQKYSQNTLLIPIKSIEKIEYKYDLVYDLEVEDNNNFSIGELGNIVHNSDGLHIGILVTLFLNKFVKEMIQSGDVSIVLPPLYGATKNKTFIPIYNLNQVPQYSQQGYQITRYKGLGEMNPDQLEVVIRQGKEYVINYPDDKVQKLIDNIVKNSDVRKALLLEEKLDFNLILNSV